MPTPRTSPAALRTSVAEIARTANGSDVPLQWRVITTDSYADTGVALACPTEHPVLDLESGPTPDAAGVYDCCPWPQFETYSETVAEYLVALLNQDNAPRLCTYCREPIPADRALKEYCEDRCRWADDDHGPDTETEPNGDDQ